MFQVIVSIMMLSQISELQFYFMHQNIPFEKFEQSKLKEGFKAEPPNGRIQIFLSDEIYPFSTRYNLTQPVKFTKIIENDISLDILVYCDRKSNNVKYYEMRIDRKKPDINEVMSKYRSQESDIQKAAELAVAELESYRLSVFETDYVVREIETLLVDQAGTPSNVTAESKTWKTKNGLIEFSTKNNQLKLRQYWE
jgi:hypothetical protein